MDDIYKIADDVRKDIICSTIRSMKLTGFKPNYLQIYYQANKMLENRFKESNIKSSPTKIALDITNCVIQEINNNQKSFINLVNANMGLVPIARQYV